MLDKQVPLDELLYSFFPFLFSEPWCLQKGKELDSKVTKHLATTIRKKYQGTDDSAHMRKGNCRKVLVGHQTCSRPPPSLFFFSFCLANALNTNRSHINLNVHYVLLLKCHSAYSPHNLHRKTLRQSFTTAWFVMLKKKPNGFTIQKKMHCPSSLYNVLHKEPHNSTVMNYTPIYIIKQIIITIIKKNKKEPHKKHNKLRFDNNKLVD